MDMEATDAKIQTSWSTLNGKCIKVMVILLVNTLVQQNLKNGTKEGIETSRKLLNINYLELMKHVDHH